MSYTLFYELHRHKGKTVAQTLHKKVSYVADADKTRSGETVTSFGCDAFTAAEEFLLQRRQYNARTGKCRDHEVIGYQIIQSFEPGEVSAEEANRLGQELAMRFTKGHYAFIVASHTDRPNIHNHILINSVSLDGERKLQQYKKGGIIAVRRLNDLISLEHGLPAPQHRSPGQQAGWIPYLPYMSARERICRETDRILAGRPGNFAAFLEELKKAGLEIRDGTRPMVRLKGWKRFISFSSLPEGYREIDIRAALSGSAVSGPGRVTAEANREPSGAFDLFSEIENRIRDKGPGYEQWARRYNPGWFSRSLLYLRDNGVRDLARLSALAAEKARTRDRALAETLECEKRISRITELKTHTAAYLKTRDTYAAYRRSGRSRRFLEAHREEVALHKSAAKALHALGAKTLPDIHDLDAEQTKLLSRRKEALGRYRQLRDEAKDLIFAERAISALLKADGRDAVRPRGMERQ